MKLSQPKPVIGVIACGREVEGEPAQAVKLRYLQGVEQHAGAVPLMIPSSQPAANARAIAERLDAVLLTGSNSNIEPHRFGSDRPGQLPVDNGRDELSLALIHAAIDLAKPLFGICRGLQEINVALGGTLRDLRDSNDWQAHHAPAEASLVDTFSHDHPIHVVAGSQLYRYAASDGFRVNSVHYQAIDRLADGLVINATGSDGIVEAVSAAHSAAPVFAVQWHPEWRAHERPHDLAFWHYLGEAARTAYMPAPGSETTT
jgi:putative glutamine amidotransferase